MSDAQQLLRWGTVLRWTAWLALATILCFTTTGSGLWLLWLAPVWWTLRLHLVFESKPRPITDADIWRWVDGRR